MTLTFMGSVPRGCRINNVMGVAKAALEATVRYLASDLGPSNIRVNAISAGPGKDGLGARGVKDFSKVFRRKLRRWRRLAGGNTDPAEVG